LPKFKTEYLHKNLVEIMQNMGVETAFNSDKADFLNMYTENKNISISKILQKTFIEVDETGTEAAAATVIGMSGGSAAPTETIDFICDRPFMYFIRNDSTGNILFMGEYAFVE
jgi:serpin B